MESDKSNEFLRDKIKCKKVNGKTKPGVKKQKIMHFRAKCAEIFLENGNISIVCEFCDLSFKTLETLINHIYKEHLFMKLPEDKSPVFSNENTNIASETVEENLVSNKDSPVKTNENAEETIIVNDPVNDSKLECNNLNISSNSKSQQENNDKISFKDVQINYQNDLVPKINESCGVTSSSYFKETDSGKQYKNHQGADITIFICSICPKLAGTTFMDAEDYNLHMENHLRECKIDSKEEYTTNYSIDVFPLQNSNETNISKELFGDSFDII